MHILPLQIVEQQPAVLVIFRHVHAVAREEVRDDLVPEPAEIPARILTGYVVAGVLLTAVGIYEPIVEWGRASRAEDSR